MAGDLNSKLELVVFHSSQDYATYSGALFGNDTNNGGIYLEGNPPRLATRRASWPMRPSGCVPPSRSGTWNHEYTHYLDGRFDMAGDFSASVSTPQIWWIEGPAEYISYSYRGVPYTDALNQAKLGTYSLSTLMDTTYKQRPDAHLQLGLPGHALHVRAPSGRRDHSAGLLPPGQLHGRPHLREEHHRHPLTPTSPAG